MGRYATNKFFSNGVVGPTVSELAYIVGKLGTQMQNLGCPVPS